MPTTNRSPRTQLTSAGSGVSMTLFRHRLGNRAPWMRRVYRSARTASARHFLRESTYEGSGGTAWCAGFEKLAPSIAAFFCGATSAHRRSGHIRRDRVPDRITDIADAGGLPIVRLLEPDRWPADLLRRAIVVPQGVDIHTQLPADPDSLRAQLLTSTTREDFRRIRRANFSYRVTRDPDVIREFHARPLRTPRRAAVPRRRRDRAGRRRCWTG